MNVIKNTFKQMVCEHTRRAYEERLFAGTSGNLSFFDRAEGVVYITPTSFPYESMTPSDIVTVDINGKRLEDSHEPSSEMLLHLEIYQKMPRVNAVVHTHSPFATSFAVTHDEIPFILIEMEPFLGGSIPVAAYAKQGSREVGIEAVKVMSDRNACLMANHGVVAVGEDLDCAHINAIYVEDAAKIYYYARSNGGTVHVIE